MAKIIKFINLSILFIFMFLVVTDVSATTKCKNNFECRFLICMNPLVPKCKVPYCRCM
ncbi:late nodulin [Medicago truncatula]|uniref:Late nodulin n=1 Tax=Medicago truncatula TaxID=3880 RepID=G7JN37_MEDTR|nr:late nodulin [Medicago truncatula]